LNETCWWRGSPDFVNLPCHNFSTTLQLSHLILPSSYILRCISTLLLVSVFMKLLPSLKKWLCFVNECMLDTLFSEMNVFCFILITQI
jgi:hypothetical protein